MSLPFDAALKDILGQAPDDLRMPFRFPALHPAQTLNIDLSTISAATDMAIGFGDPVQEIVDLNFQSGPDAMVDARLLLYNAALHLKFAVPVRSILVLLRPKAETRGLNGKLNYASGDLRVSFEYEVIRLWKEPVQVFLEGELGLLPLAPLCRMPEGRPVEEALREVVHRIDHRLSSLPDHAKAVRLMTAAFILTGMRVAKEMLSDIYEGVRIMHQTTAWDSAVDEGVVKGELRVLLKLGRQRFGNPDKETKKALAAINDLDRLDRMAERILRVRSWQGLLAVK